MKRYGDLFSDDLFEGLGFYLNEFGKYKVAPVDGYEENGCFHFLVDLPGFEIDDINVRIESDYLVIDAKQKEIDSKNYFLKERPLKSFHRAILLNGNKIDFNTIKASYKNGVLKISFGQLYSELDIS